MSLGKNTFAVKINNKITINKIVFEATSVSVLLSWDGVILSPLGTSANIWSVIPGPDDGESVV
jgi:hypothetical protein